VELCLQYRVKIKNNENGKIKKRSVKFLKPAKEIGENEAEPKDVVWMNT